MEKNEYTIDADTIYNGARSTGDIEKAVNREKVERRAICSKGDIVLGEKVRASGYTAFVKLAKELSETLCKVSGVESNRWNVLRDDVINSAGNDVRAKIMDIPTFGARVDDYSNSEHVVCVLSRSYAVKIGERFVSEIFAAYGIILPTIVDFPTAEKFSKVLNRLFVRRESPAEVFGKNAADVQIARIKTLEETQARLLAEIAELKAGK